MAETGEDSPNLRADLGLGEPDGPGAGSVKEAA